jgi:hypothetical protein
MIKFDGYSGFDIDLTGRMKFGDLSGAAMASVFSDGRVLGHLVESLLESEVEGFVKAVDAGSKWDVISRLLRRGYEVKTTKESSFDVAPSGMKGKGRSYNHDECVLQIRSVHGLLLCRTDLFPLLRFAVLAVPDELEKITWGRSSAKVSYQTWCELRTRPPLQ